MSDRFPYSEAHLLYYKNVNFLFRCSNSLGKTRVSCHEGLYFLHYWFCQGVCFYVVLKEMFYDIASILIVSTWQDFYISIKFFTSLTLMSLKLELYIIDFLNLSLWVLWVFSTRNIVLSAYLISVIGIPLAC